MVEVGERFAQVKLEVAGVFRAVGQLGGLEGGRVGLEHLVQVVDYRRRRMVRARTCQRSGVETGTDECLWLACKADWGEWEEEEEQELGTHWRISLDWRRLGDGWEDANTSETTPLSKCPSKTRSVRKVNNIVCSSK